MQRGVPSNERQRKQRTRAETPDRRQPVVMRSRTPRLWKAWKTARLPTARARAGRPSANMGHEAVMCGVVAKSSTKKVATAQWARSNQKGERRRQSAWPRPCAQERTTKTVRKDKAQPRPRASRRQGDQIEDHKTGQAKGRPATSEIHGRLRQPRVTARTAASAARSRSQARSAASPPRTASGKNQGVE